MKKIYSYGICLLLLALSISCTRGTSELPSLKESFSKKDKDPFGCFVFYNQLDQLYYRNSIRTIKTNFEATWRNINDTDALYINISKNFLLSNKELEAVLSYVYNGNSIFISSENIDQKLLDTLACKVERSFNFFLADMKYTTVFLEPLIYNDSAAYTYFYVPFNNYFKSYDKSISKLLGKNKFGADLIMVPYGSGRFYLHSEPRAISNYFLLQKDNYKYIRNIFSFTAAIPQHVYWDDYYNKRNRPPVDNDTKSGLGVLLKYPAMAWAFYLLLMLFILHVLFGGKRRQRIVPVIPPNTNTTVAFTETVSRLYLQKKDNRNIADKLITYFFEYIRNQYFLNTSQLNDNLITTLSRKSNKTKEATVQLFNTISEIQQSTQTSDAQLLLLNQQIENFYNK